jgi:hypothetical protein
MVARGTRVQLICAAMPIVCYLYSRSGTVGRTSTRAACSAPLSVSPCHIVTLSHCHPHVSILSSFVFIGNWPAHVVLSTGQHPRIGHGEKAVVELQYRSLDLTALIAAHSPNVL